MKQSHRDLAHNAYIKRWNKVSAGIAKASNCSFVHSITPDMCILYTKIIGVVCAGLEDNETDYKLVDKVLKFFLQETPKTEFAISASPDNALAEKWCKENFASFVPCGINFPSDKQNPNEITHLIIFAKSGGINEVADLISHSRTVKNLIVKVINLDDIIEKGKWKYEGA